MRLSLQSLNVPLISIATALVGFLTMLSAGNPLLSTRLPLVDDVVGVLAQQDAAAAAAVLGFALVILAISLWRRKRTGWLLSLILLFVLALFSLLRDADLEQTAVALLLAGWLFSMRSEFHARSDRASVQRGVILLVISVLFTLVYGAAGFSSLSAHYAQTTGFFGGMWQVLLLFTAPGSITMEPVTTFGVSFIASIYTLLLITVVSSLLLLSRSVIVREPATPEERTQAAQIVEAHGRSSVARMTLLDDKAYYFSPGGSVVAYVAKNGFAVALGDPIGPVEDVQPAIAGFKQFARQNGWQASFYQVLPDHVEHYRGAGFKTLPIGQEATVNLETFTLSGKARKSLRQHVNRVTDRGYRAVVHQPPIDDELYETLRDISDEWLASAGGEKRFSLGWFHEEYIRLVPIICVYNPEGEVVAFANILPEYQLNETTIDLMRHRARMESGIMDFLFVSLFNWAKEQGFASFNVGLVAFAGVGEDPDDPAIERGVHYLFEHLNQTYNFKGLYDFKNKFQPEWSPRYLVHPGMVHLPGLAVALVRADSGDDAVWTYLRELELRRLAAERLSRLRRRREAPA
ncbi:MAG: phosphatidylglycerol lysyltransferase domain-containing protein [Chloroflexota bacterium]